LLPNAALTRGTPLAGPKAMQASDIGSNGLVGAACGGAGRDMDPKGQRRIGDAAGGTNNILNSFFSITNKF
jgi:hypothetical protein